MALYKDGVNGYFSGKVGSVVGCLRKGRPYMRGLPKLRSSTNISIAEKANREKFALAQSWLKHLTAYVRMGFKNYHPNYEGFVAAKSYLLKNAMKGSYPDLYVDASSMVVSYGDLPGCDQATATFDEAGNIQFKWTTEKVKTAEDNDLVMVLVYDPVNEYLTADTAVARRSCGEAMLDGTVLKYGGVFHTYISFTSIDREKVSISQYLGDLQIKK